MTMEFKVGIFVVLALAILSIFVFQIGGADMFHRDTYALKVVFDFVNGITINAPVRVAGVTVGDVRSVNIFFNESEQKTQVELGLRLKQPLQIARDSVAYINTLGILGEKYVEIVPGVDRHNFLVDGDLVQSKNPVQLEKLTESLVDIVGDQTVRDSLRESFANVRAATDTLNMTAVMLEDVVGHVKAGEGTIGRFVYDESVYTETQKMIADLNVNLSKTVTDLNAELTGLIQDLKRNPWKLLHKPRVIPQETDSETPSRRRR